jgi:NAD(P)H dehydrogenase (quinone)
MIVVTGANGSFGRRVAQRLLTTVPASKIVASVRRPAEAADLARQGVTVRHGDFDQPATVREALAGADTVLLNATNYGTPPQARARQQEAVIQAAVAAGARRIVFTSWPHLEAYRPERVEDYARTERALATCGLRWTVLRQSYGLAAALARDVRIALTTGVLAAPAGDARTTPAALDDLAEATAAVLASDGHDGATYELTGPDAIDWDDLAALASRLAGKEIAYRPVPDAEFRSTSVEGGFPEAAVLELLELYAAFRAGWTATPSEDLLRLLRRPPTPSLEAVGRVLRDVR